MSGIQPPPNTPDISAGISQTTPPELDLKEHVVQNYIENTIKEWLRDGVNVATTQKKIQHQ